MGKHYMRNGVLSLYDYHCLDYFLSYISDFVNRFLNVLVKEKRWVVFKGEQDPTSVPGKYFQFIEWRKLKWYLFVLILVGCFIKQTSFWSFTLCIFCFLHTLVWNVDYCSWMDMLAEWSEKNCSNSRGELALNFLMFTCHLSFIWSI